MLDSGPESTAQGEELVVSRTEATLHGRSHDVWTNVVPPEAPSLRAQARSTDPTPTIASKSIGTSVFGPLQTPPLSHAGGLSFSIPLKRLQADSSSVGLPPHTRAQIQDEAQNETQSGTEQSRVANSRAGTSAYESPQRPGDPEHPTQAHQSAQLRVGSLGVRGLLRLNEHTGSLDLEHAEASCLEALDTLRASGIRRVHALMPTHDTVAPLLFSQLGFAPCPGETLFVRDLRATRGIELPLAPDGYELRGASIQDIVRLRAIMGDVPELAILDWEWQLITNSLQSLTRQALVVEHADTLVGALIGGYVDDRATISHLWVDPSHRKSGLGRCMTAHSLTRFQIANVTHVHVMTTAGNDLANRFWTSMGFEAGSDQFLEVDL